MNYFQMYQTVPLRYFSRVIMDMHIVYTLLLFPIPYAILSFKDHEKPLIDN